MLETLESRRLLTTALLTPALDSETNLAHPAVLNATSFDVGAEATPTVSVGDVTVTDPAHGKTVRAVSLVTLSAPATAKVQISYTTQPVTASGNGDARDFIATKGVLVIAKGKQTGRIDTVVVGTRTSGSDEVYDVVLKGAKNATLSTTASGATPFSRVVIRDNAASFVRPTLTVSNPTVTAGTAATFVVSLSSASASDVSVRYTTESGTATTSDYTAVAGILTIPGGQTSATISVPTAAESTGQGSRQFTLQLDAPANANLASSAATATINAPSSSSSTSSPTLSIARATTSVGTSGTSTVVFTVSLSAAAANTVSVNYTTADGTAVAGTDYTATSGTLTFAPGVTTQTVDVTVTGESTTAATKTLTLNLSGATNTSNSTASATGTITYTSSTVVTLSNNLSNASGGTETATGTTYVAASFSTGSSSYTLNSVTLELSEATAGQATVEIFTDEGLQPGTLVGTLASPSSYSTTLAATTFTASGITLSADSTYWVVLVATTGSFNWSWTSVDTGTGTGFTDTWAQSIDAGADWFAFDSSPTQMSVVGSTVS